MKKLWSGLCATTLAASFAIGSAVPLNAAPVVVPKAQVQSDVVQAQSTTEWWRRNNDDRREGRRELRQDRREDRRELRQERREDRREVRRAIRNLERRGDFYYYNGHRGYRERRPGYRYHEGYWFPAAAFIAGALVTGAIAAQNNRSDNAHVAWCYDRYKSYRASDNTFQPYNGPRQQCYSPYD